MALITKNLYNTSIYQTEDWGLYGQILVSQGKTTPPKWTASSFLAGNTDLTFTGSSTPFTLNSSTGTDVTFAAGSGVILSRSGNELTISAPGAADGNGIYGGSDTIPTSVTATVTDNFNIAYVGANPALYVNDAANQITLNSKNTNLYIGVNNTGISIGDSLVSEYLFFNGTDTTYTSTVGGKGIQYAADYSGGYTNRSLVDKGYVLSAIATYPTSFTAGSVIFSNGTNLAQDNADFFWSDGSNYLGIGTSSPNSRLDVTTNNLGVTQTNTSGIVLSNNTAAAAGAQQMSPGLRWRGNGWKTNATAASQTVDFLADVLPVQGASAPGGNWQLKSSIDGGAYTVRATFGTAGFSFGVPGGSNFTNDGTNTSIDRGMLVYRQDGVNPSVVLNGDGALAYSIVPTTGTRATFTVNPTFTPTSGTAINNFVNITPTINQTGGANGITRGLYVNPTLTAAADWRSIETSNTTGYSLYTSTAPNYFGGNTGIGTTSADRLFHVEASDAVTNAVTYTSRESHITSGTATTGFGVGREWELENASGTNRVAATEEITWSDAVDATEDATYTLKLIRAGTLTEAFNVTSAGALTTSSTITSGNKITAGSGNSYDWASRSRMLSPSDGVITFYNNAATDFSRLQFGGTTSSFPSIKRNGTGLDIRLADDSGYASLSTGPLTGFGNLINYSLIETQSGGTFAFNSKSKLTSDVNGNLTISNNAVTDFGLLKFGGTTSSFPALKRSSTELQVRLANDSGHAGLSASYVEMDSTITASGTTGNQTINKVAGSVNFAASALSEITVTNSFVTTNSVIIATVATNDPTMKSVSVVAAAGEFKIFFDASPTNETRVNFLVINPA